MKILQMYTSCLAHGAYWITSNGEAAIVDPLRDIDQYIELAKTQNVKIKYILETHFHADFVSGHLDLSLRTGAPIIYGPGAKAEFEIVEAADGQIFPLGNISIQLIHTPGHTLESSCFLLRDEHEKPSALFSGDTLFIGDVGRPDLAVKSDLTKEELAGMLYDSIHRKLMHLPDEVVIYPGHGQGSACGKSMSKETQDTLGHQKATNYALRPGLTREQFIQEVLDGQVRPPQYFFKNAALNKKGYEAYELVLERGDLALDPTTFHRLSGLSDVLILDSRKETDFLEAHIQGSINIGVHGTFAPWVGALIEDIDQKIIIVADPGKEVEVITRLSRVGYDHCIGFLSGGIHAWESHGFEVEKIPHVSAKEFVEIARHSNVRTIDARRVSEQLSGKWEEAISFPLDDYLVADFSILDKNEEYYVYCAGGYRSSILVSLLKKKGFQRVINVDGGYSAINREMALV